MKYEIIKFINDNIELDVSVSPEEKTVWLSQNDMVILFDKSKSVISRHLKNILEEYEINPSSVYAKIPPLVSKNATTGPDGKTYEVNYYSLDVITKVGNRTKSKMTQIFYSWAKNVIGDLTSYDENDMKVITFSNNDISLDVRIMPENDTVYLTKDQMTLLFGRNRSVISKHIKNIYSEGELELEATCAKNAQVQIEGDRIVTRIIEYYNLDIVISVGYRVKSQNGIIFRKWALNVLKQYLLKGYVINEKRTLVTNENYINLINKVDSIDNRVTNLENENLFFPKQIIIYENQSFDAILLLEDIISKAKETIVLIDPYTDEKTLNVIKNKQDRVNVTIVTSEKTKLSQIDLNGFNSKYGGLTIVVNNNYHDRYLILDDTIFYHLGSSINYLGNKFAQIDKIEDEDIKELLRKRIHEQN